MEIKEHVIGLDRSPPLTSPTPGSLEYWASIQPDKVVVHDGERSLTWAQLNDQANQLAFALRKRGLAAGDIVIARTQIRLEWVVIAYALAKLQCPVLGLNWRLTASESRYVLNNSKACAIICDDPDPSKLMPAFEGYQLKTLVSIDTPAPGFESYADLLKEGIEQFPSANEPKLVIYTSGTTGLPKGVVMGRRADVPDKVWQEYEADVRRTTTTSTEDVFLVTMPVHHGSAPSQIMRAIRSGATIVLLRRFDPLAVLELIAKYRVSQWTGVPTMYKRIAALQADVVKRYDVSSIRELSIGAAPVPYELKTWIIDNLGDCLREGYGSTETGMLTRMDPAKQKLKPGSSGQPHPHVIIQIRNESGQELPAGEVGEIWVKTPCVIKQYLNSAPLGPDTLDENGFFRTGDVGRVDEDNYLYISDRAKDMIIRGGVNIYPAEIEAVLLTHPSVMDAAVFGVPDDEFGEQVMAYCELKPGKMLTEEALLAHCSAALASYKRPKSAKFVNELPRNTMGKILKRELRDPFWKNRERNV